MARKIPAPPKGTLTDAHTYLVMGPNSWAVGETFAQAWTRWFEDHLGRPSQGYLVWAFPTGVQFESVGYDGSLSWRYDDPENRVQPQMTKRRGSRVG